jgi:hypothetical protein
LTTVSSLICAAIAGRRVLRFEYGGGERVVEPHAHGTSSAGVELVLCYQVAGHSMSGPVPGWRMFKVAGVTELREDGATFGGPRPDYNPANTRVAKVCCQL